jgi:hypothetical protein
MCAIEASEQEPQPALIDTSGKAKIMTDDGPSAGSQDDLHSNVSVDPPRGGCP